VEAVEKVAKDSSRAQTQGPADHPPGPNPGTKCWLVRRLRNEGQDQRFGLAQRANTVSQRAGGHRYDAFTYAYIQPEVLRWEG